MIAGSMFVVDHSRKSVTASRKSAFGGKVDMDFGQLEVSS